MNNVIFMLCLTAIFTLTGCKIKDDHRDTINCSGIVRTDMLWWDTCLTDAWRDALVEGAEMTLPVDSVELLKLYGMVDIWIPNHPEIDDLIPLKDMPWITLVNITGTKIDDLGPLKHVTSLMQLFCDSTDVKDISPLYGLRDLWRVCLGDSVPMDQIRRLRDQQGVDVVCPIL